MKSLLLSLFVFISPALAADTVSYRVLFAGEDVGHLTVERDDAQVNIVFDYKQNGRGPTIAEQLRLDGHGYPSDIRITGTTTFGSAVDEYFRIADGKATWKDTTGSAEARLGSHQKFYIVQNGSLYTRGLMARALSRTASGRMQVYPSGEARLETLDTLSFDGPAGPLDVTAYQIHGLSLNPELIFLDSNGELFGTAGASFSMLREGYTTADEKLRKYAEALSTKRFVKMQADLAHKYDAPVRIRNVHVFDPVALARSEAKDVVVYQQRIASVQPANSPASKGEVIIDGAGGTLVPGMYEMHGHLGQESALLNIAAGVTSVRDMGNENAVLEGLIGRIEGGEIAGPRITRSCFIEGKSDFSAATGETVSTLEEGLTMVRWCAARGFHQIKLYNSMRPEWAKTLVDEAQRLGMRVAGHVPAFSSADAMIDAGFNEITHINQLMLGWVLKEGEDTRTLFRFTAMKRFPSLDLDGEAVQSTLNRMAKDGVAHDPTVAIHEHGMTAVDGQVAPFGRAIYEHLPTNEQRSLKSALFGANTPEERAEYVAGYKVILDTLKRMHQKGLLLLPGTDMGGGFAYHRELELFAQIGLSPAEALRRASYDMASYLGQVEDLGSIETGKYADFFLVPGDPTVDLAQIRRIQMVIANGVVYFPSEIYPAFGIEKFADAPVVIKDEGGAGD